MNNTIIDLDIFSSNWVIYKIIGDSIIIKNSLYKQANFKKFKEDKKVTFKKKNRNMSYYKRQTDKR